MTEQQRQKQQAIDLLGARYRGMENVCEGIDMRLRMYFDDLLEHSSARLDDPNDWHGLYELLGAAKFLLKAVRNVAHFTNDSSRLVKLEISTGQRMTLYGEEITMLLMPMMVGEE